MEASEAILLDLYPFSSELWTKLNLRGGISRSKPGGTATQFTSTPRLFYVRKDDGIPDKVVNVFSNKGELSYTIERGGRLQTLWTIYKAPSRVQVGKIKCGLMTRTMSFMEKPELHTRSIGQRRFLYGGLPDRKFYLNDGAPYEWSHNTQYLERIINSGGGHDEKRIRLARVRSLRQFRFDWELLVDPDFDEEVALASAFISMLTEWSTARLAVPGLKSSSA